MHESSSVRIGRSHAHDEREPVRVARIDELGVLAAGGEDLDAVVHEAADIMEAAVGAISVLAYDQQYLVAAHGVAEVVTSRATSFCTHVVARNKPLIVRDATRDPMFADNPRVGFVDGYTRAYCGIPLASPDGLVIAVFCVRDLRPRSFTPHQLEEFAGLGAQARQILLPYPASAPVTMPAARDAGLPDDCRYDPLFEWIERVVPHEPVQKRTRRWHGRRAHERNTRAA